MGLHGNVAGRFLSVLKTFSKKASDRQYRRPTPIFQNEQIRHPLAIHQMRKRVQPLRETGQKFLLIQRHRAGSYAITPGIVSMLARRRPSPSCPRTIGIDSGEIVSIPAKPAYNRERSVGIGTNSGGSPQVTAHVFFVQRIRTGKTLSRARLPRRAPDLDSQ